MKDVALVTGSSRGIGAAIAALLARRGYAVCINYLEQREKAEALVAELRKEQCVAMCLQADVADRAQVDAMVRKVEEELGHISLLVNNAGIARNQQFQDVAPETLQRIFAVNFGGCFHCSQAVIGPMLKAHEGCIINISSIWGSHGASCESVYSSTKHAIIGLTRSLAAEFAPSGIRVNCVAPGVIETDMIQALGNETLEQLRQEMPFRRFGTPEEVAESVWHLAKAEYITGQILTVDGGFLF
ncbi:MAG: 3-oxoacyl-ACP reductase FabG [Oscillospiraceae bacterium]|nr:3-oxoacyl-ACP reductase FabG [Oscillospiraceae bacterium]MBQ3380714.1 3-oxoacyl-ACP reductase FabG [Oscillospiraceae bacterium]MBQ6611007.1 3-oxoacyl-ACP reductase FabG [Oscillospiraceae bacterium]MBQ9332222.1 3-oxoacyl-ACP reductase FabG [Oscillospiraceae bacterium]